MNIVVDDRLPDRDSIKRICISWKVLAPHYNMKLRSYAGQYVVLDSHRNVIVHGNDKGAVIKEAEALGYISPKVIFMTEEMIRESEI